MKQLHEIVLKTCPIFTFSFSVILILTTFYISEQFSFIFAFMSIQIYLNWYAAYKIAKNAPTLKVENFNGRNNIVMNVNNRQSSGLSKGETKVWYCTKCQSHTRRATYHCTICEKCYHFRDHHCLFIGICVLRQNMGHFILICFYSAQMCFSSLLVLGPYLYEHFIKPESSIINVLLNFCFPVALFRFLFFGQKSCVLLVTLFDVQLVIFSVGMCYGIWKLRACLNGKQRYNCQPARKESFKDIFGDCGFLNVLFPIDSLIDCRFNSTSYELKLV